MNRAHARRRYTAWKRYRRHYPTRRPMTYTLGHADYRWWIRLHTHNPRPHTRPQSTP